MSQAKALQSIRGMNDILPQDAVHWQALEAHVCRVLSAYDYQPMRLPIVEPTPLFRRAIGEVTDIVEKEMYSFVDSLNGEALTLRPEGTAGCVRAVIQHHLAAQQACRLYYMGPMFRHERPQKGRYRQFHQIGVEAFGFNGPDLDAEMIAIGARLWRGLGLADIHLEINSLGQAEERLQHRAALIEWFEKHADVLDEDAKRRLYTNPLRILDSKNPAMQEICAQAPKLMSYLGEESLAHFNGVCRILDSSNIAYRINPRLVRGLDYYNLTVFEWVTDALGAQGTVCAGGRYDTLVEQMGGKPTPACGFAMGVERLLALMEVQNGFAAVPPLPVYLVHQGEAAALAAVKVAEMLRDGGMAVRLHCGGGSFKAQMKKADASGALFAVIIGDNEAQNQSAELKWLRGDKAGQQQSYAQQDLAAALTDLLKPAHGGVAD